MFLLDTPLILELRKARAGQTDPGLVRWASAIAHQNLYMSALSLLELETSVSDLERRDKVAGASLRAWLDSQVMRAFDERIVPIDADVVRRRAQLSMTDQRDALLAATASVHGLVLVTRTPAAFRAGRIKTFNPWGYTPETGDEAADWRDGTHSGPQWFHNLFARF